MKKHLKEIVGMSLFCSMIGSSVAMASPFDLFRGIDGETTVISSDQMEVVVDSNFPRVIEYHMDGKTMYGQDDDLKVIRINDKDYIPKVTANKDGDKVTYEMLVEELGITIHAELAVINNTLEFNVTKIDDENASEKVKRFEIPDHGLLSVKASQPGAHELGIDVKGGVIYSNTAIEERNQVTNLKEGTEKDKTYLILNTDDLAGAITTNAMNIYGDLDTPPEERNISYANETKVTYKVTGEGENKTVEASAFPWTYREYEEEAMDLPYAKVSIAADINQNGTVDWQDGAVAYRDILPVPKMSEEAKKSIFHIAYTRASLAQWPFDKTLDMVKKLYLYTDGFGQFLQYKGYQAEGHDSNHPDYGDSFNPKVGGVEGLNHLATEALNYNCNVGVHLNHTEAYPEAKNYSYDLVTGTNGWDSLDLSKKIDRYKDAANDGEGGLKYRLNQLKEEVPDLKWVYYDVYEAQGYAQWKLAHETMSPSENGKNEGLAIASEFQGALDPYTIWGHVQCQASPAMRIMRYNMTDQFFYDPILLESRHAGSMGYGDDGNQDQGTNGQTIQDQIDMFYNNNLLFKYMQNHNINETTMFGDENRFFDEVYFDGNVSGRIVSQRDRTSGTGEYGTNETRQPIVELAEDGRLVARYQKKFEGKTTDTTVNNGDSGSKKITPMMAQYLLPWDTELDNPVDTENGTELYHYNSEGGTTEWELPESWKDEKTVTLYQLSDVGRINKQSLPVADGIITITAEAEVPYLVCKNGNDSMKTAEEVNFGQYTVFSDPGFETKKFGKWEVSNPEAAQILTSETSGETFVEVTGADATTVSQKITGLESGKTYQLSAWVEVDGKTATLGIKNGGQTVENDMYVSEIDNQYYNSLRYNDEGNKMQRLKLEFTAKDTDAEVYIRANEGEGTIDFDDFRMVEKENTEWAQEAPEDSVFFWDFEFANDEGWGPFVPVQNVNRAHLSETHTGYTNDTIQGKYSFKIRDSVGGYNKGEAVRTIGSNMRLENGKTYTIQFDYWMKTEGAYDVSVSAGYVPGHQSMTGGDKNNLFAETLDYEKTKFSKTFTVPDDGREYGLSFFKNLAGKEELIIDNVALYEGEKELSTPEAPTYNFDNMTEESSGKWVTAVGSGHAAIDSDFGARSAELLATPSDATPSDAAEENAATPFGGGAHLEVVSGKGDSIFLDENTNDIQDGSIEFDVKASDDYEFGIVTRYIDSDNYNAFRYVSDKDGWRNVSKVNGEAVGTEILNMPGVLLNRDRTQHVKVDFTGDHYKLVVDGITLFDDTIEGLRTEGGRLGFITNSKVPVSVDNILIKGDQAAEGTPIVPEGGAQEEGTYKTFADDDAYVVNDGTGKNYGAEKVLKVKNDRNSEHPGYWRQAYLKFPLPEMAPEAVDKVTMNLYLSKVGVDATTENVYLVSNDWEEDTIVEANAPVADGDPVATFEPKGMQGQAVEINLTDAVTEALANGEEYISLAVQRAESGGGSNDIEIASFENGDVNKRPTLEISYNKADRIALSDTEIVLAAGEEKQLEAELVPYVEDVEFTWESLDEDVATVDENGLVTAVANGKTYVKVSYENADGKTISAKCKVEVKTVFNAVASNDAYIRGGSYAGRNFGSEGELVVKNDGGITSDYWRQSYLQFPLDDIPAEAVNKAVVKLYLTTVGGTASTENVYVVDSNWDEGSLTADNAPTFSGNPDATFNPQGNNGRAVEIDLTDEIKAALKNGEDSISIAIQHAKAAGGSTDIKIASSEYGEEQYRPTLEIAYDQDFTDSATPSDADRKPALPIEKPDEEETVPPMEDLVPPTEEVIPPMEDLVPPTEEVIPPTEETEPPTEEVIPPTEETEPPTEEVIPPTEETESSTEAVEK